MKTAALRTAAFSLALALGLAGAANAQGPTPNFQMGFSNLDLNSFNAIFLVQGPPNSPVSILYTLDNPFTTPASLMTIYPLINTQTNPAGYCQFSIPVVGQGPFPEIWLGAVILPPGQPGIIAGIKGVGIALAAGAVQASAIVGVNELTNDVLVQVHSDPNITFNVYLAPYPCPQVGANFNTSGAGVSFQGAGLTNGQGNGSWTGNFAPGSGCLVVIQGTIPNTVVIGKFHL